MRNKKSTHRVLYRLFDDFIRISLYSIGLINYERKEI